MLFSYDKRQNYTELPQVWIDMLTTILKDNASPVTIALPEPQPLISQDIISSPSAPPPSAPEDSDPSAPLPDSSTLLSVSLSFEPQPHATTPGEIEEDSNSPLLAPSSPSVAPNYPSPTTTQPSTITTKGFLKVRTTFGYTKYFFVLSVPHVSLYYTSSPTSNTTKGVIQLNRYAINVHGTSKDPRKFRISTAKRTITLVATSAESKWKWIAAINACNPPTPIFSPHFAPHARELRQHHAKDHFPVQSQPEITPSASHTVSRIIVEKRFFFFDPKEMDLADMAKSLAKELNNKFPNQRTLVVYQYIFLIYLLFFLLFKLTIYCSYAPARTKRGFRKNNIGTLDIHRSLDLTSPHFYTHIIPPETNIHNPDIVNHLFSHQNSTNGEETCLIGF